MYQFWKRNKRSLLLVFALLSPILPLILFRAEIPRLNLYDNLSTYIVHPVAHLIDSSTGAIGATWRHYIALSDTAKKNESLEKTVLELQQRIRKYDEKLKELGRLEELLQSEHSKDRILTVARVIGQDLSANRNTFFIDRGFQDGVRERMAAVSNEGIVGTVRRVFRHSSLVVSLDDVTHIIDGRVSRSRARVIVEGRGKPLLGRLKYLDRSEDIRVGDEVLSSGMDGVFPKGYLIGIVVQVQRPQAGVLQEAALRSAVDLANLEELLIVKNDPLMIHPIEEISEP